MKTFVGYQRRDWLIAVVISCFILLIAGTQLTKGMPSVESGDYAAYILTAKSIVDGSYEEQITQNYIMHPSALPEEAEDGQLVYVWGYPLFLSLIYSLVGLDLVNYSTIIFYKLPSLIAFSLTAGILYLYYRRFLSETLAVILSLAFAAGGDLMVSINKMYSDIVFLCASCCTLWAAECFFESFSNSEKSRKQVLLGIGLGFFFWISHETRLNGITLVLITAAAHIIRILQQKLRLTPRQIFIHLSSYITFFLLKVISEKILLPATPNVSDIGNVSFMDMLYNISYYIRLTLRYLDSISRIANIPLWPVLGILFAVGIVKEGFRLENIHLTCLMVGTYVVLFMLPYAQGLRYLANILPIILLYISFGGICFFKWMVKKIPALKKGTERILLMVSLLCLLCLYIPMINTGINNIRNERQVGEIDAYSADAIDMYRYIQEYTFEDEIIAYQKPRILSLNTGRLCLRANKNGHVLEDADYYLYNSLMPDGVSLYLEEDTDMELYYENCYYSLYKILKE